MNQKTLTKTFLINLAMRLSPFGNTKTFDSSAKKLEQELKARGINNIKLYYRYKLPNNTSPKSYIIKQALRLMYLCPLENGNFLDIILTDLGYDKEQIPIIKQKLSTEIEDKKDFYTQELIQDYKQLLELNPELPDTDNLINQSSVLDGAIFGFGPDEIKYFITDYHGINDEYKKLQDKLASYGIKPSYILCPKTAEKIINELEKTKVLRMTITTKKFDQDTPNTCGGKATGLALLDKLKMPVPQWMALNWNEASNTTDNTLNKIIEYFGPDVLVAVRSSAANEDGTQKSFAGMFESKLNIPTTKTDLHRAISSVIASGVSLRVNEYDGCDNNMGIVIQKMVNPVISGVAFTSAIDTDGTEVVLIEVTSGLGDKLVSGQVTPTQIKVPVHNNILDINNISFSGKLLPGIDLINHLIEKIQILRNKSKKKLDTEWCIDSNNNIWFVQARPITSSVFIKNRTNNSAIPVVGGTVTAPVYIIQELCAYTSPEIMKKRFADFPDGAILIALYTEVDFVPIMKRAAGIITEQGGVLSHAAILSRELGIPCIVNYPNATHKFKNGDIITMNATIGQIKEDKEFMQSNETAWMDEAWLFDNMKRIPYNGGCVLVESLPNRLNVYAPWLESKDVPALDLFIRKKFGVAPNIIRDDSQYSIKFCAWFEDRNRDKLPAYSATLNKAHKIAKTMSASGVHRFYQSCINTAKKYILLARKSTNAATKLYYSETVISQYIILDVIFPRAIALYQLYYETAQKLHLANATFADLLALKKIHGIPKKYYDFISALSQERNDIYPKFQEIFPEIENYYMPENSNEMQRKALNALGIKNTDNMYMLNEFYKNLSKIKK